MKFPLLSSQVYKEKKKLATDKKKNGIVIILLVLCILGLIGCGSPNVVKHTENLTDIKSVGFVQSGRNNQHAKLKRKDRKAIKNIEYYAGIKLPVDMEVLFNYQPTGFVQGGRNHQYTVFKMKDRPDNFLTENKFKVGFSVEDICTPSILVYTAYGSPVPKEFFPPWGEEFVWASSYPVYLIYFEAQKWLIAIVITN